MKMYACIKRQCDKNVAFRCVSLLVWLAMSIAVVVLFVLDSGGIISWVNQNPAVNLPILFFSTLAYVSVGFWFLKLNSCNSSEIQGPKVSTK